MILRRCCAVGEQRARNGSSNHDLTCPPHSALFELLGPEQSDNYSTRCCLLRVNAACVQRTASEKRARTPQDQRQAAKSRRLVGQRRGCDAEFGGGGKLACILQQVQSGAAVGQKTQSARCSPSLTREGCMRLPLVDKPVVLARLRPTAAPHWLACELVQSPKRRTAAAMPFSI